MNQDFIAIDGVIFNLRHIVRIDTGKSAGGETQLVITLQPKSPDREHVHRLSGKAAARFLEAIMHRVIVA